MIETYYAGAYWGGRRESAEACAQRALAFFHALADCDGSFARWFGPARSRKQAPPAVSWDIPTLRETFTQGSTRNDEGHIIEDLGFHVALDNGMWPGTHQRESAALRIICGGWAENVSNSCVLNLPSAGASMERLVQSPVLEKIMRSMILAWEPDWGVVNSSAHLLLTKSPSPGPRTGWMLYLSHRWGALPPLPAPVRVEPVEDKGTLVTLTPERFTASNPEHVALASRVREALSQAGLLKPLS
jgi:hypothetical protein